jgi:hypothetical protein
VRDDQAAIVEHVVADERVDEVGHACAKVRRLGLELGERLREPVRDLHVAPAELAHQLDVVIPGNGKRGVRLDRVHDDAQHVGHARSAVDEIAEEDEPPPLRMPPDAVARRVAEGAEQLLQLLRAAVHVADDVERTVVPPPVVPERLPLDRDGVDLLDRAQHVNVAEALALEIAQRALELAALLADDVRAEVAIGTLAVPRLTHPLRQVEHDRHRQCVVPARQLDEWLPRLRLDVGRVDDRQQPALQSPCRDVVQHVERRRRR